MWKQILHLLSNFAAVGAFNLRLHLVHSAENFALFIIQFTRCERQKSIYQP
jgi:hypothetical protein